MGVNKTRVWGGMILGVLILAMMGCASTTLVQSWQEPTFNDKPLEKILVLGVFENDLNRRLYEDAVVNALAKENRVGITGYSLMPNQMIWAGATRSFNPKSEAKLVKETAELITKDMKKDGLL